MILVGTKIYGIAFFPLTKKKKKTAKKNPKLIFLWTNVTSHLKYKNFFFHDVMIRKDTSAIKKL